VAAAQAARVVRAIGDALDLRTGATPKFDGARLNAWAENPAQRFADRLPALAQTALTELAAAIGPTCQAYPACIMAWTIGGAVASASIGFKDAAKSGCAPI